MMHNCRSSSVTDRGIRSNDCPFNLFWPPNQIAASSSARHKLRNAQSAESLSLGNRYVPRSSVALHYGNGWIRGKHGLRRSNLDHKSRRIAGCIGERWIYAAFHLSPSCAPSFRRPRRTHCPYADCRLAPFWRTRALLSPTGDSNGYQR